jgi:hypothetical protein
MTMRYVMSTSLGFGGINASLVFRRMPWQSRTHLQSLTAPISVRSFLVSEKKLSAMKGKANHAQQHTRE